METEGADGMAGLPSRRGSTGSGSCPVTGDPAGSGNLSRTGLASSMGGRLPGTSQGSSMQIRSESVRSELANKLSSTHLGRSNSTGDVFSPDKKSCGPSGGFGSKEFPPAYNIIRAGKAMRLNAGKIPTVAGLDRVPVKTGFPLGGLSTPNDDRSVCARNYHCVEKGLNISLSIDKPSVKGGGDQMMCLACSETHSIAEKIRSGFPILVIMSDQNFPPILPAKGGNCAVIVRVEDALLSDLESVLLERFNEYLPPHGQLVPGSVILIGSLSHLQARGLADYAAGLVSTLESVLTKVGAGVRVLPLVNVPLNGVERAAVVRGMMDLDGWLSVACGSGSALPLTRNALWGALLGGGGARPGPGRGGIHHDAAHQSEEF